MTTYTYAQLEQLWINAGGSQVMAPTMAAIAEAESGGNSDAENPSGATGLWQILGAVNPADQDNLTDPTVNAKEAVLKYTTQGLGAWVTYTSGAYKQYLSGSTTPDGNVPTGGSSSGSTATLDSASTAACLVVFPSLDLGITSVGGGCLITKSEARAVIGAALLAAGAGMMLLAALVLAASAFDHSGAGKAVLATTKTVGKAAAVVGIAA